MKNRPYNPTLVGILLMSITCAYYAACESTKLAGFVHSFNGIKYLMMDQSARASRDCKKLEKWSSYFCDFCYKFELLGVKYAGGGPSYVFYYFTS